MPTLAEHASDLLSHLTTLRVQMETLRDSAGRSPESRHLSVCITELEGVEGRLDRFIVSPTRT